MVYHVGRPAMFDGNRFLPDTGTPIWKMVRSRTVLAVCDPEPFTVATCTLKSLTMRLCSGRCSVSRGAISMVAIRHVASLECRRCFAQARWGDSTLDYTSSLRSV